MNSSSILYLEAGGPYTPPYYHLAYMYCSYVTSTSVTGYYHYVLLTATQTYRQYYTSI